MADSMLVLLLLAFIWAAVLIPPAAGARASREAEFMGSIRPGGDQFEGRLSEGEFSAVDQPRFRPALTANARRRQVLGGLVVALGATLFLGLLPTFRLLLVVHLFLLNSCLAYIGLLVHLRDQRALADGGVLASGRAEGTAPAWLAPRPVAYGDDYRGFDDLEASGYEPADEWDELAYAEAYAGSTGYAEYDDYDEYDGDDEAAAEAAYVDEELALARPA